MREVSKATSNYLLMALPKGRVPVRYIKRDDALLVDLRSLMEAIGLAWSRWLDALMAQVGVNCWPLEAAHDWQGRDTQLLVAAHVPNLLGWVAEVAPKMYPSGGPAIRRVEAARRGWADSWWTTAPQMPFTGFVTASSPATGATPRPDVAEAAWAGRRGQPITRETEACVKEMLAAGKGRLEVSAALGISPASVSLLASGKYRFAKAAGQMTKSEMGWRAVCGAGPVCARCAHAEARKPNTVVCAKGGFVVLAWIETCRFHEEVA